MSLLLLPLIVSPYLTRTLGSEPLGRYQYMYAVISYFCIFCILGIATYGNRECAVVRDDRRKLTETFWGIYGVQGLSSLFAIAVYIGYLFLCGEKEARMGFLLIPYLMSYALDITWLYYGLEYFYKISLRNFVIKLLSIILILLLVKSPADIYRYCLIQSGTICLSQAVLWPFAFRYIDIRLPRLSAMKRHIKPILLLFLPVIGISIYSNIDKIMIGDMLSKSDVAIYTYAENLAKLPIGIVTALTTVLLPRMSKLVAEHKEDGGRKLIRDTMRVTMYLTLPVAAGIAAIAEWLVPWFYAEDFLGCIPLIRMLVVIVIFIAWTYVMQNQCLVPRHRDTVLVKSALLTAILNIICNLIFIPICGIYGAVIGTILSEGMVMMYKTYHCRDFVPLSILIRDTLPVCVAAIIMYAAVYGIGCYLETASVRTTAIQILAGILIYGACTVPVLYSVLKRKRKDD